MRGGCVHVFPQEACRVTRAIRPYGDDVGLAPVVPCAPQKVEAEDAQRHGTRVPQSALSAVQPFTPLILRERVSNLDSVTKGLGAYLANLPSYAQQLAAVADLEALGEEYDTLTESKGKGPAPQAEEASTGAAVSSKRDAAPSGSQKIPPAKKTRTRLPTHLVVKKDVALKAGTTLPVGLVEAK